MKNQKGQNKSPLPKNSRCLGRVHKPSSVLLVHVLQFKWRLLKFWSFFGFWEVFSMFFCKHPEIIPQLLMEEAVK